MAVIGTIPNSEKFIPRGMNADPLNLSAVADALLYRTTVPRDIFRVDLLSAPFVISFGNSVDFPKFKVVGQVDVLLDVNQTSAFRVSKEGAGSIYIRCNTTVGAEALHFNDTALDQYTRFFGSGDVRFDSQLRIKEIGADPTQIADNSFLYAKDVAGITELFARSSDGTVHQITPPASDGSVIYGATGPVSIAIATTTFAIVGKIIGTNANEVNVQLKMRASGTLKNLRIFVSTNNHNGITTIRVRKNGVNGNQLVSYAALGIGEQEDLVNTDTFVAGDLISIQLTTLATSGLMVIEIAQVEAA